MRLRSRLDLLVLPAALAAIAIGTVDLARGANGHDRRDGPAPPAVIVKAARLAAAVYGVSADEMIRVSRCESVHWTDYTNERSGAKGPWQWIPSSWRAQGIPGHSPYDPYAAALATARAVSRDGGWRQWDCKPW